MKSNKFYIFLIALTFFFLKTKAISAANNNDSSKIKSVDIMSFYFNHFPRFDIGVSTLLKLKDENQMDKRGFYKSLNETESVKLLEKISSLIKFDTIMGVIDNNMDLRFLIVINYESDKFPIYIGIEAGASGRMFINGKRYKRDKMFIVFTLNYITNKGVKKSIQKDMKSW